MFELIKELATHPYVISAITLFIAFYLLRDTVRAIIYICISAMNHTKSENESKEESP